MDYRVISHSNVTALIHRGEDITPGEARELVRRALRVCGYAPWERMTLEIYEGPELSLLVASPAEPF